MSANTRLRHLETVWSMAPDLSRLSASERDFLRYWSAPIFPGAFHNFCRIRARMRFEQDQAPRRWYSLYQEEGDRLIAWESEELDRLTAMHGAEEAWDIWHSLGPEMDAETSQAVFHRELVRCYAHADACRSYYRAYRAVWPEWREGMTTEEQLAFDRLLNDEGEKRCRW